MPSTRNPASLTPEERTRELARLLATGLVRLGSDLLAPASSPPSAPEESSESAANGLAVVPQKSVTVTGG
ncbi:hypothetical protein J8F10_06220 [Gemmata sp. G18]|uniref:Uncharacterized protein n=1 Tax=Gemmata palustris TaxID=2822762 RepID=A0ABS5BMD6_9BACT|nr:hypothetical protein [Gemmata palustris]MBP3954877.1 hypothetical protein [Gemmata palustris]